ncbi:MAG: hypothetical protein K0S76_2753 [Herbinix sp.]|jgi:uncharacterized protein YceK|nr:hypothetical protein [Herbinix sp.]
MKRFVVIIAVMLLLVGCGNTDKDDQGDNAGNNNSQESNDNQDDSADADKEGYKFTINDVTVPMNVKADSILEALGEPLESFEAPSCAFQGMDKIYNYGSYEVNTYPNEGTDIISAVDLKDDTVATEEGIYIGSTLAEVIEAYGEAESSENGLYTYTLGDSKLTLIIKNDVVEAITYLAVVEGL